MYVSKKGIEMVPNQYPSDVCSKKVVEIVANQSLFPLISQRGMLRCCQVNHVSTFISRKLKLGPWFDLINPDRWEVPYMKIVIVRVVRGLALQSFSLLVGVLILEGFKVPSSLTIQSFFRGFEKKRSRNSL
jgi:hypothetical protein